MKTSHPARLLWAFVCISLAFCAQRLSADTVETTDGARIVGKVALIDSGFVTVDTDYAGTIKIKQDKVAAIETDKPITVRLESGTSLSGTMATQGGVVTVAGAEGSVTTPVSKIAESWPTGEVDPAILALERHWKYEASLDINGTTGNQNQLGIEMGFSAKLAGPQDALDFTTDYNRQTTEGVTSADQFKAGVDYSNNFSDGNSWFVRDDGGFDRIQDITFYDTAAAGYGYDLVKNAFDTLTVRAGLAYRYDAYSVALTPTVNSTALDFEINHDLKMPNWELGNHLTVVPATSDFANVVCTQDSFFQIPLANPAWKLRSGVSNNYVGEPPAGIQRLDTTYYTRLILDW